MKKETIERRNDLVTRAEEIVEKAKEEEREITEEEIAEIDKIEEEVEAIDKQEEVEERVRSMELKPIEDEEEAKEEEEEEMETRSIKVGNETVDVRIDEMEQFENYIRGYMVHERTDMTKADNGAVIPTTIVDWIIRKVYDICPILARSQRFNVTGNVSVPYYPADANNITVAYADEFVELTGTAGKFGQKTLTGFLAGALTKISRSLVNNTKIDIVGFVVDEMAQSIARFIEGECIHGTPTKIEGLSTLTNIVTTDSSIAFTADELVKLHDKVKDQFQNGAFWIMSPEVRTACRLLKDREGRFIFNDDATNPFGAQMFGKPVYTSDNMPGIGAGNKIIYYGNFKGLGTKFSENINIQVLRERFATEHVLGVVGWLEFDAKVLDEQQLACLQMAV